MGEKGPGYHDTDSWEPSKRIMGTHARADCSRRFRSIARNGATTPTQTAEQSEAARFVSEAAASAAAAPTDGLIAGDSGSEAAVTVSGALDELDFVLGLNELIPVAPAKPLDYSDAEDEGEAWGFDVDDDAVQGPSVADADDGGPIDKYGLVESLGGVRTPVSGFRNKAQSMKQKVAAAATGGSILERLIHAATDLADGEVDSSSIGYDDTSEVSPEVTAALLRPLERYMRPRLRPMPYQMAWLDFFAKRPDTGGINGDDMGLGKTYSVWLAVLTAHPPRGGPSAKKALLVANNHAVLNQWIDELQKFFHRYVCLRTALISLPVHVIIRPTQAPVLWCGITGAQLTPGDLAPSLRCRSRRRTDLRVATSFAVSHWRTLRRGLAMTGGQQTPNVNSKRLALSLPPKTH